MHKSFLTISLTFLLLFLSWNAVSASSIWFDSVDQYFNVGDTLEFNLMANIDSEDAIMGFGYDLSFDYGSTFIGGPGASGNALTFNSFAANSALGFTYDPLFDDGDTINGYLGPFDLDVYGNDLLLGTFSFTAFAAQPETIFLTANDYGTMFSTEGLVPGFTAAHADSILPNTLTASASPAPVPEPATWLLISTGLFGFTGFRKKILNR